MLSTGVEGARGAIMHGGTALYYLPPRCVSAVPIRSLIVEEVMMCDRGNGVINGLQRRSKRSANLVPFPVLGSN